MKKILLINPPLYYSDGAPHSIDATVPPLGLLYIASYINKYSNDFKAEIIDVGMEGISLNEIKKKILFSNPFVIGITSMTPQLQGTVELARFIKKNINEDIKIFLGGPHISADTDFICRYSNLFDYAITGEGEKTFLESLNKLMRGEQIPKMQESEVIIDLDTIPFPDKTLINRYRDSKHESMIFSRGCPYDCYYCSRPAISKKIRYRTVANMVEEIKQVYKFCNGRIDFQDDTFTLNRKRVLELCEEIQKTSLKLEWQCNTRIDLVDDEILHNMKKAGCSLIHFGIESGNEQIRKNQIHKGNFTNEDIAYVFNLCRKYGIKIAGYFMIGHPGESRKELLETRDFILKSGIDMMGLSIPTPFPGSRLYEIAKEKGIINEVIIDSFAQKELGEGYSGNYPVYVSEKLDKDFVFSFMKSTNRRFYFNPAFFTKRIFEDIFCLRRLKQDIRDFFSLLLRGMSNRKPYINKSRGSK